MKAKKYLGELGRYRRPVLIGENGTLLIPPTEQGRRDNQAKNLASIVKHETRGLDLLIDHYGVEKGEAQFNLLALHLARDWVPFFRPQQRKRGPKANPRRWALLEIDIALRRLAGDRSDAQAVRYLCGHVELWKPGNKDAEDAVDTLTRERRSHAKEVLVRMVRALAARTERLKVPHSEALSEMRKYFL